MPPPRARLVNLVEHLVGYGAGHLDLTTRLRSLDVAFREGIYYVLSLRVPKLPGTREASSTASHKAPSRAEKNVTFVGSMVYDASITTVRLYAKLQLSFAAPAVGTNGVLQGEKYSVRFIFGGKTSIYDVLDSTGVRSPSRSA